MILKVWKGNTRIKNAGCLILVLGFSALPFYYFCLYERKSEIYFTEIPRSEVPFRISHMGYGVEAPRSSLIATSYALRDKNTFVDLDVQLTKDDSVVVFHDRDLAKNTNSDGSISSLRLEEVEKIKIKGKMSDMSEETIHLLDDHLDMIEQTESFFTIEIKNREKEKAITTLDLLKASLMKRGLEKRALIVSADPIFICRINKSGLSSMYSFVDGNYFQEYKYVHGEKGLKNGSFYTLPWYAKSLYAQRAIRKVCPPKMFAINYLTDKKTILKIKKAGYSYFIWSPNTEKDILCSMTLEPYAIVSDTPSILNKLLVN